MKIEKAHIERNGVECVPLRATWPPAWLLSVTEPAIETVVLPAIEALPAVPEPIVDHAQAEPEPAPPAGTYPCRRCGSVHARDVEIHHGASIRRDCGKCGRFLDFPVWYGNHY